jgi:hypothetical protein
VAVSFAQELRSQTAAVRLRRSRLGVRRALTRQQQAQAAAVFSADGEVISASKRLLNTRHDAWRKVVGILTQATGYWQAQTVAYPEPGVRLIRRDKIPAFNAKMEQFRADLLAAVQQLQAAYGDLREAARANLGTLYNQAEYPATLTGEFELAWEYPSIEPPAYLKELNPALYEQEQARIAARFEESVRLTEEALAAELQGLVAHLCDQLTGRSEDGQPRRINRRSIENIREFFSASANWASGRTPSWRPWPGGRTTSSPASTRRTCARTSDCGNRWRGGWRRCGRRWRAW